MLKNLPILPGLFNLSTDRGARGRWKDGDHVRFYRGLPQKIGGWKKVTNITFSGKARAAIDWQSLLGERIISLATHLKLYVCIGGALTDITPIRESGTLALNPISTTNGLFAVTITDTVHGNLVGNYVHLAGAAAVGGITISGEYVVQTVPTTNSYTITHSIAATSTATGGGAAVTYQYEINVGGETSLQGFGYGAGTYGTSTYGTPRTLTGFLFLCRTWSLDMWGEDLIACVRDGGIYLWDTSVGVGARATLISGTPASAKAIFVSPDARHLVALGAHDGVANDPLLIRWSSSENYSDWTETETNTAGSHRVDIGNKILCGVKTDRETLVFTDAAVYSMIYQGNPYQFEIRTRGSNGGLIGPNAVKEFLGRVFWMSNRDFFVYDGQAKVLGCDVLDRVMFDINRVQGDKVFAGANREFGEVWWLYCSAAATEVDRYVIYSVYENHWTYGTLERTVIVGDSDTFTTAYAAGADGHLYDHEIGSDDDTSALVSFVESGDVEIPDGNYLMRIKKMVPDFDRLTGSAQITLSGKKYPHSSESQVSGPHTVTSGTQFISPRIRARQVEIRLETSNIGDDWRMGEIRVDLVAHGKK